MTKEQIDALLSGGNDQAYEAFPAPMEEESPEPKKAAPKKDLFVTTQRAINQFNDAISYLEGSGVTVEPLDLEKKGGRVYPWIFRDQDERVIVNYSIPDSFDQCRQKGTTFKPRIVSQVFMITQSLLTQVQYPQKPLEDGEIPYHFLELDAFVSGFAAACAPPMRELEDSEETYRERIAEWSKRLWLAMGGRCYKDSNEYMAGVFRDKVTKEAHSTAQPNAKYHQLIRDLRVVVAPELGEVNGRRHLQIAVVLGYEHWGYNVLPNEKNLEMNELTKKQYTVDVSGFTQFCQSAWSDEIRRRMVAYPGVTFPDPDCPPPMAFFVETTRDISTDYFNYVGQNPDQKGRMKKFLQPKSRNAAPNVGDKRKIGDVEPDAKRQATEQAVSEAAQD